MTTTVTTPLYTPAEAAEQLGLHPKTLVRFAREGRIGHVPIGRKIRFRDADIEAFIADNAVKPRTPEAKPSRNPRYSK